MIDRFIQAEAKASLDPRTIDIIRERLPRDAATGRIVDAWVDGCLTILRSVLIRLEREAEGPLAGMLSLVPVEAEARAAIKERVGTLSLEELQQALRDQPGQALLLLAMSDSDMAASLIAREVLR